MAGKLVTSAELVGMLGIHRNTLNQWIARGCPIEIRGSSAGGGRDSGHRFDLAAVVRWREDEAARSAAGDTAGVSLEEARQRKVAAEAALAEIEVAKARGKLVEIETVATVVGEQFAACRARLLPMPSKLAPLLAATTDVNEIQALLEQGIHEALSELSGDGIAGATDAGDSGADGGELEAAPEVEGVRVGGRKAKAKS